MSENTIRDLESKIKAEADDEKKTGHMLDLAWHIRLNDPNRSIKLSKDVLKIAYKLKDKNIIALALKTSALAYNQLGNFDQTIKNIKEAIAVFEETQNYKEVMTCCNLAGRSYSNLGDYSTAIEVFHRSLKYAEEYGSENDKADCYSSLCVFYQRIKDIEKAQRYGELAVTISKKSGANNLIGRALINLGNVYGHQKNWTKAIATWTEALEYLDEKTHNNHRASVLGNLGLACISNKEYNIAENYLKQCLKIKEESNDSYDVGRALHSLSMVYKEQRKYDEAIKTLNKAQAIFKEIKANSYIYQTDYEFYDVYKRMGDFEKAIYYLEESHKIEREVQNEEMKVKTEKLQSRIELEKSEKEKEIYRLKNIDLAEANQKITKQKEEIELKNKDITDSINYAQRIQKAILPNDKKLKSILPHSFVLFKPKDVLSGDFFWIIKKEEKIFLAAADCTGHGVPGALLSIVGHSLLTRIVREKNITQPSLMLQELNEGINQTLKEQNVTDEEIRDGMDIALCCISQHNNKTTLEYAGANRPLLIIKKDTGLITEIKADKTAIGNTDASKKFNNHKIELASGDTFYVYSDGYADQFGGFDGKKFMTKRLKDLLQSIQSTKIDKQSELLETVIMNWKGDTHQTDDILVIGVRIE